MAIVNCKALVKQGDNGIIMVASTCQFVCFRILQLDALMAKRLTFDLENTLLTDA